MGATVTKGQVFGGLHTLHVPVTIALTGNYAAGGIACDFRNLGPNAKDPISPPQLLGISGYYYEYDLANRKIKIRLPKGGGGLYSYAPGGGDIKGSANIDSENVDAASKPTNADLLDTLHAVAAGAWAYTEDLEMASPRNVVICILNDSGGPLDLFEGITTFAVTGTWRGSAQSESITVTSNAGNKAVANTKYRYKYGVKPFDTITNVVMTNAPADGIKIGVGIGSKLGLPVDLYTPIEADVQKIVKTGADVTVTGTVNTTNMTVNLGTLADGDDVMITFKSAESAMDELQAAALPAGVTGDTLRAVLQFAKA